ncbi:MAG: hypothetical protein ACI88H_000131 [Cocleimonas sp.]|jgi:hypothetical protein
MSFSIVDLVKGDGFTMGDMGEAINKVEFVPNQLGSLNIYQNTPIRSSTLLLDVTEGSIRLVKTSKRGEPIESRDKAKKGKLKAFSTDRLALKDDIAAEALAFLRDYGTADQPRQLAKELAERQAGPNGLMADIDLTREFQRLGGLRGKLFDTDGTLLYDYFSEMGVSEPSVVNINFATLTEGDLRVYIVDNIKRPMKKSRKGAKFSQIIAICESSAYDKLSKNPEYRKVAELQEQSAELRNDHTDQPIDFAGVTWVEYEGTDDDTTVALAAGEIIFVPAGLNNTVFKQVLSPGEKFSDLGTEGQEWYSWLKLDDNDDPSNVELSVASYNLMLNTRPEMVRIGNAL